MRSALPSDRYMPICEPVTIPPSDCVRVRRAWWPSDSPGADRFLHFHDLAEIVVFERVEGEFHCGSIRAPIGAGSTIYAPPMAPHDFVFQAGQRSWTLVQIDMNALTACGPAELGWPTRPLCARPTGPVAERIRILTRWLVDLAGSEANPAESAAVAALLLTALGTLQDREATAAPDDRLPGHRLQAALERLHRQPGAALPVQTAATLCGLSVAYFSRLFRSCYGRPFSDHIRIHRLQLAAQRLAADRESLSQIAYALGFASPSHFSACFRERFGMTPSAYRAGARRLNGPGASA
jgi:AraC-like DNA-binding protein